MNRASRAPWFAAALAVAAAALVSLPAAERWRTARALGGRVDRLATDAPPACGEIPAPAARIERLGGTLASWQTVGGCGAGSAAGIGGIKWIGRGVRGGLFSVQCQGNYTRFGDGYSFALQNQLTTDLGEKWNVGVVVPVLYKYQVDPLGLASVGMGFDLSNSGIGDINALVTRRFGPINATAVTASVGFPTGTHKAQYLDNALPQDRQLGAGRLSGALMIDHTLDNLWGPAVLGGVLAYPGGENDLQNYRSPSASLYAYVGYLLGPVVPAAGLSATGFAAKDRDRAQENLDRPQYLVSGNVSLEWSSDWVALLAGLSLPFSHQGLQPWTAGLGLAFAPF